MTAACLLCGAATDGGLQCEAHRKGDRDIRELADEFEVAFSLPSAPLTATTPYKVRIAPVPDIVLRLPLPPSANQAWRAVGSKVLLSAKARAWKREAATLIEAQRRGRFIAGKVLTDYDVTLPRHRNDLSNILKLTEDSLKHVVFGDDCEVYDLHMHKRVGRDTGITVRVRAYTDEQERAA